MGFRLQKRIRIFKGLTLNLSKSGPSWTLGGRGATLNIKKGRVTSTLGVPGTGISYRRSLSTTPAQPDASGPTRRSPSVAGLVLVVVFLALLFYLLSVPH